MTQQTNLNMRALHDDIPKITNPPLYIKIFSRYPIPSILLVGLLVFGTPAMFITFLTQIHLGFGIAAMLVAVICIQIINAKMRAYVKRGNAKHNLRLKAFAKDNDLVFSNDVAYVSRGALFVAGNNDHKTGAMLAGNFFGHDVKLYTHRFTKGSGKTQLLLDYGVVEIKLPKILPHIFIDSKKTDLLFGEALDIFKNTNMTKLEGDFNSYFTIFTPKQYHAESLTILNPAFMHRLIESAQDYDLEFVNDTAFVYIKGISELNEFYLPDLMQALRFACSELDKQLDTFRFTIQRELPSTLQVSSIKKAISSL